ncbi:MAG: hypothetical protein FD153_87 [Rhodospirillaceae bacterium]|nr:MAG: hypothetical protein FD153_87 [Rhodospirillaceae bacterium]
MLSDTVSVILYHLHISLMLHAPYLYAYPLQSP